MNTVRDRAKVTVTETVDGTKEKRRRSRGKARHTNGRVEEIRVLPEVWAAAKAARREGERLVIESESVVWLRPE